VEGGWLETPRAYVSGYEVRVDGLRVGKEHVRPSVEQLLQVEIPPGEHRIEVRFVGTIRLWVTGAFSLAVWLALAGLGLHRLVSRRQGPDA
jgi:hypothetical protein